MKPFPNTEPDDGFEVLMRRQGWRLTGSNPASKVIQWHSRLSKGSPADQTSLYEAFGDKTVRKLIRSVLLAPRHVMNRAAQRTLPVSVRIQCD